MTPGARQLTIQALGTFATFGALFALAAWLDRCGGSR